MTWTPPGRRLPALVGRDPAGLDAAEIARAVVESVAENTVDAVVAAAVWAALAGAPAGSSPTGPSTPWTPWSATAPPLRPLRLGGARADDVADWLPARLTALLVAAVRPGAAAAVWRAVRRPGRRPTRRPTPGWRRPPSPPPLGCAWAGATCTGAAPSAAPTLGTGAPPGTVPTSSGRPPRRRSVAVVVAVGLLAACGGEPCADRLRRQTAHDRPAARPPRRRRGPAGPGARASTRARCSTCRPASTRWRPTRGRSWPATSTPWAATRPGSGDCSAGRAPWASNPDRLLLTNGGAEAIALVAAELEGGWVDEPDFSLYRRHLRDLDPAARPLAVQSAQPERAPGPARARRPRSGTRRSGRWRRHVDPRRHEAGCDRGRFADQAAGLPRPAGRLRPLPQPGPGSPGSGGRQPPWALNGLAAAGLPELLDDGRPARLGRRGRPPPEPAAPGAGGAGYRPTAVRRQLGPGRRPRSCASGWPPGPSACGTAPASACPARCASPFPTSRALARLEAAL